MADRAAQRTKCTTCHHKAARILTREALDAAVASAGARRPAMVAIFEYVVARTGLPVTINAFTAHIERHESERYRAWLEVRYGSGE